MTCCAPIGFDPHPEADPDCGACNGDGYQDCRDLFAPQQSIFATCHCVGKRVIEPARSQIEDADGWMTRTLVTSRVPAKYYGGPLAASSVRAIVLHNLAKGRQGAGPRYFADPADGRKVSAHLVVHWDGGCTQCVPVTRRAYHAGSANGWSIGIEHDAPRGEPWSEALLARTQKLVEALREIFPLIVELRSHRSLSPRTRTDPVDWDWERWEGLGLAIVR